MGVHFLPTSPGFNSKHVYGHGELWPSWSDSQRISLADFPFLHCHCKYHGRTKLTKSSADCDSLLLVSLRGVSIACTFILFQNTPGLSSMHSLEYPK